MTVDRQAASSTDLDPALDTQYTDAADQDETTEPEAAAVEETPLTEDMVHPWLARIRPSTALALLREPEYAAIAAHAFTGFRLNTQGYANPIVRRRLAQVAVKVEEFADKLRQLSEEAPVPIQPGPERPMPQPVQKPDDAAWDQASAAQKNGLAALRTDRDRRRRERDEARAGLDELHKALAAANAARQNAERELQQLQKTNERQAQRIERFERQIAKLRSEQASLVRALSKQQAHAPTPAQAAVQEMPQAPTPRESHWENAVRRFLDRGHTESALLLAAEVLRADPDDVEAREIAAAASEQSGDVRAASEHLRHALTILLAKTDIGRSLDVLSRLLLIDSLDQNIARLTRQLLGQLRATDTETITNARAMLARLRALRPAAFTWLVERIEQVDSGILLPSLIPQPGALELEDTLPLPISHADLMTPLTALGLIEAVDTGDVGVVLAARGALTRLSQTDPRDYDRVVAVLQRAARDDQSYLATILGPLRGPIVVDGSNAAWHDQSMLSSGGARLRSILDVRRALRAKGYFPIVIFADAPLPYTVDEPEMLREMVARGEIQIVEGGVDADEVLSREAKRLGVPLVTNDYMTDWDPNNEVVKIRFAVSLTGDTYLLNPDDAEQVLR